MATRRTFIKSSVLGTAALSANSLTSGNFLPGSNSQKPIVISTWDFGVRANSGAWKVLSAGGRALDAVEAGVKITEADLNNRTVGLAGYPDRDGYTTLDACIMDESYNCGSVCFLQNIKHPVSVARMVMEKTPHIMLVGEGAKEFAIANGFQLDNYVHPDSEKDWKEWLKTSEYKPYGNINNHDTIGMIALDNNGNLSGACTTSGLAFKMHGRVGDSPIIGAGLYVDNEIGAATATGVGEEVIRISGTHLVVEMMRQGNSPYNACKIAVERIVKIRKEKSKDFQVAFLAINKSGEFGAYCLQPDFEYAVYADRIENKLFKGESYY